MSERQTRLHGEVMLKQPLSTRIMVVALVLCIGIAGVWVTVGDYARTEQVRGILLTTQPSARIYAPRQGTVSVLHISEGDRVEQGARIAVVHTDLADKKGHDTAATSLHSVEQRLDLANQQASIARDRGSAEQSRLAMQVRSIEQQIRDSESQLAIQEDIVASNEKLFRQVEELIESGFVSGVEYERRHQNMLNARQMLGRLRSEVGQLLAEQARAQNESGQAKMVTASQLAEIEGNKGALKAERAQFESEQGFTITAPISGRVTAIQAEQGQRVTPERPMMIIVPDGAELYAGVYAPTRAIGFVKPGQEVRLLFDAFPYQRFGSYEGTVDHVSRIIIDPREADVPFQIEEPVYRVRVSLAGQDVNAFGESIQLQPGMILTANIVLEEQSFLDWLLTPLRAVLNRA